MNGYIKLHRKILEWGWYDDANTFRIFICLLLTVNWEAKTWHGRTIHPGQRVTSRAKLAEETGMSEQSVRSALYRLKSTGEITCETTNRFTLVTVLNWGLYQSGDDEATNETTGKPTTKQPTNNQQSTNNQPQLKKEKKEKNEKKEKKIFGAFGNVELSEEEYEKLGPGADRDIEKLSAYMKSKGKTYKDHYATIINWRRMNEEKGKPTSFAQRDYTAQEYDDMYEEVQA